jgi:DNA polymerase III, alpha subunit (gram-positive type)
MGSTVIVLDFETTGMSPNVGARPTEVAAVRIENGKIVDRYQSLMNAGVHVPAFITELTGITNAMVRNAPPIDQVMRELHAFVDGQPLVAHNVSFDRKFLEAEWLRLRLPMTSPLLCSLLVSRRLYPHLASHKLGALVEHLNLPRSGRHHRALADTEMTAHLWLRMAADIAARFGCDSLPLSLIEQLQSIAKHRASDYLKSYREQLDQAVSGSGSVGMRPSRG